MCTLYSQTKSQDALNRLFKVKRDRTGNLPSLPDIYPDQTAPVIRREAGGERAMDMMRWGFPPPPNVGGRPVVNVRNAASPYWRNWLKREFRCLVPATSFCEYTDTQPKVPHWFALDADRSLFSFAGIWRPWNGTRGTKANPIEGDHFLFSILTTEANDVVGPIHAKAMPVILTGDDCDVWLEGDDASAMSLQRPVQNHILQIAARGQRADPMLDFGARRNLGSLR